MTNEMDKLVEAFGEIEKHDLKVSTIICTICGGVISKTDSRPCEHLLELAKDITGCGSTW